MYLCVMIQFDVLQFESTVKCILYYIRKCRHSFLHTIVKIHFLLKTFFSFVCFLAQSGDVFVAQREDFMKDVISDGKNSNQ